MELDLSEYMGAYIDGSRENLDLMDKMLLNLEQNPSNIEAVGEIFRAAHTLKGMSATMGFEKVAHLTHEMENLLDKLRNNQLAVTPPVIDLIFETFDILRTLVDDSINQTESTVDLSEISAKLAAMANGTAAPTAAAPVPTAAAVPASNTISTGSTGIDLSDFGFSDLEVSGLEEAKDNGKRVVYLKVSLVADCLLKGPRVFMIMRAIDECQAEIVKSVPEVKDLENEKFERSFKMMLVGPKNAAEIKEAVEGISEVESVETSDINPSNLGAAANAAAAPAPVSAPPVSAPPPQAPVYAAPPQQPVYAAPQQPVYAAPPQAPAYAAPQPPAYAAPPQAQPAYPPQAPTPVSVPTGPTGPAIAQPVPPPQQQPEAAAEAAEEVEKETVVTQLITFTMAGETYALEISQVETIINLVNITRVPKAPSHIDGVINLRGEIIPVINTRRRLKLAEVERSPLNQIIILSFDEEKVKAGFLVDSVQEVIRLPETSIEPPSRISESVDIEYLRGVGKIDSKIIILLNAHRIVFDKPKEE